MRKGDNIYVVKNSQHRDGFDLYSYDSLLKKLQVCTGKLRVQLTDIDNKTLKADAHVFYEGHDAAEALRWVEEDWGIWVITELKPTSKEDEYNFYDTFGIEPLQIIVSLNGVK